MPFSVEAKTTDFATHCSWEKERGKQLLLGEWQEYVLGPQLPKGIGKSLEKTTPLRPRDQVPKTGGLSRRTETAPS